MKAVKQILTLLLVLGLSACGGDKPAASSAAAPVADRVALQNLVPHDPELAAIYQRSCKACHGLGTPAIPQAGDVAAWAPRMDQGMDALLDNVINGIGGMPPLGMCMDCEPEQFEALITFMATKP
ncbi:MAG: c-type cytochrome [Cellvibrionaceae bacterium]|nr:c-type cytochrome [Cellvibrionaceae bacterium]